MNQSRLVIPDGVPSKWVVDCRHVEKGKPALTYLARYLYRGVSNERDIVSNIDGVVTFKYSDGETGNTCFRSLKGEEFC